MVEKKLSIAALSQQSPRRLMLHSIPCKVQIVGFEGNPARLGEVEVVFDAFAQARFTATESPQTKKTVLGCGS
jgi:hypothetical protein